MIGLVLLTVGHATLHRRLLWLVLFTCITIVMEQVLIRSGTHCHSEALFMVSQCSSANSVAVYVSGLYVCSLASVRLQLHPIARPFATAILFRANAQDIYPAPGENAGAVADAARWFGGGCPW